MGFCHENEDVCSLSLNVTAALIENFNVIFRINKNLVFLVLVEANGHWISCRWHRNTSRQEQKYQICTYGPFC